MESFRRRRRRSIALEASIYARERVGHVWLVDPALKTLEALRLDDDGYRILNAWHGDAIVQAEPFEEHALHLADLWSA